MKRFLYQGKRSVSSLLVLIIAFPTFASTFYFSGGFPSDPANWITSAQEGNIQAVNFTTEGDVFVINSGVVASMKNNANWIFGNGTSNVTLQLQDTSRNQINCAGKTAFFTLMQGSTLITANGHGVVGTSGSISPKISISLSENANYVFNGFNQTADGLPASVNNLTFGGVGHVTLSANLQQVNGQMNIQANATVISKNLLVSDLVMDAGSTLLINASYQVTVSNSFVNNGFLKMNGGWEGTATILTPEFIGGTNTAHINFRLKTPKSAVAPRNGWYITTPVTNATSDVFKAGDYATSRNRVWTYNEPSHSYSSISNNTTSLVPGTGYALSLDDFPSRIAESTFSFNGTLVNGDITIPVSSTGSDNSFRGYNLIGNPYMSFLDWNQVDKTNVSSIICYRTAQNGIFVYDYFDGTDGTSSGDNGTVSEFIPPMQAFWVYVPGANTNAELKFTNAMRTHQDQITDNSNLLRVKSNLRKPTLRIQVSNGNHHDQALLLLDNQSGTKTDAIKISNKNIHVPEIYLNSNDKEAVIKHLGSVDSNTSLKMGFRPWTDGSFSISAVEFRDFPDAARPVLIDHVTGAEFDMSYGDSYDFTSDAQTTNDRFEIVFRAPSITTDNISAGLDVFKVRVDAGNNLVIEGDLSAAMQMNLFDLSGKKVLNNLVNEQVQALNLLSGIYILQIQRNEQIRNFKIIVK